MIHILLPTDFSDNAYNAICYAIYLFENKSCTFYLMHAYQTGPSGLTGKINRERETRLFKITEEEAERKLNELWEKEKAKNKNPKHRFEKLSVADAVLNAIGKSVIDYNIAYIFMGTKGASGLKEVFLGSNTVKVIKEIDFCPTVAVPDDYSFDIPDEILFVTGFKRPHNVFELDPLLLLAKLWNSKILILNIMEEGGLSLAQQIAKKNIDKKLGNIRYKHITVSKSTTISKIIIKTIAENKDIGMLAMIDYHRNFLGRLTRESVVKKIGFRSEVPFLAMHPIE